MSRDSGHIVTMSSATGLFGVNGLADYCTSKSAAIGFHESVRAELYAMNKIGVHTTLVCSFVVNTGMFAGVATRSITYFHTDSDTAPFNGHFPGKPGLAGYPLDFQSPVTYCACILTGQAKTLCTRIVLQAVLCPLTLTTIPRGFEAEFFMGWMPFMSPNQQRQSIEGPEGLHKPPL